MNARTYSVVTPAHLRAFGGNPSYRKNQDAAKHEGSSLDESCCCVLCGKAAFTSGLSVMLSNVGEYITKEEHNDSDDLGYYPVGSDCAKKLKAAGIPIYENV